MKDTGSSVRRRKVSIRGGCSSPTSAQTTSVIEYSQTPLKETKSALKSALELNRRRKCGAGVVFIELSEIH